MKKLFFICVSFTIFALAGNAQQCNTHATVVQGVECNLLQTATDLVMPCNAPAWVYSLSVGDEVWIDYQASNCASICMQGSYSDITCADTLDLIVNPVGPCSTPATIVQGAECVLIQTPTDLIVPCSAPAWFYTMPIGSQINISYQFANCGPAFCMQGVSAELTCAEPATALPAEQNCTQLVTVQQGIECPILTPAAGGGPYFFTYCQSPSWLWNLAPGTRLYIGYDTLPNNTCSPMFCPDNNIAIHCAEILGETYTDTTCAGVNITIGPSFGTDMSWEWLNQSSTSNQITVAPTEDQVYTLLTYSGWCPTCPPDTSFYYVHVENCNGTEKPNSNAFSPRISPNPVQDIVRFDNFLAQGFAQVTDLSGRVLLSVNGDNIQSLDVSSLPNGLYMLKVATAQGIYTTKLVKAE